MQSKSTYLVTFDCGNRTIEMPSDAFTQCPIKCVRLLQLFMWLSVNWPMAIYSRENVTVTIAIIDHISMLEKKEETIWQITGIVIFLTSTALFAVECRILLSMFEVYTHANMYSRNQMNLPGLCLAYRSTIYVALLAI